MFDVFAKRSCACLAPAAASVILPYLAGPRTRRVVHGEPPAGGQSISMHGASSWAPRHLIPRIAYVYSSARSGGFDDKYQIEEEIAQGAFGIVYKARVRGTDRVRAVKKIEKANMQGVAKSEVNSLLNLDHPHIVKFIRSYDCGSHVYLVFELCTGPSLHDVIVDSMNSNEGRMTERDASVVLRHMLKAVKCCHGHFVGHYDIKPDNFMYRTPERTNLKMIDLGLSSGFFLGSDTVKGTSEYIAPECWRGIYGPEADVWSCGVVLFSMLSGMVLFPNDCTDNDIDKLVHDRRWLLEQLEEVSTIISSEAHSLLKQMLLPDRHMRITVSEALQHPFVVASYCHDLHDSQRQNEARAVLEHFQHDFRCFAAQPMLVRAALMLAAHLVSHDQDAMYSHRLAFRMLDKAGNGELSVDAIEQALKFYGVGVSEDLNDLFKLVDADRDGYISFMDFLSATLPAEVRCNQSYFVAIFEFFDKNSDGHIDAEDLVDALGYKKPSEVEDCAAAMEEVCPKQLRLSRKQFMDLICGEKSAAIWKPMITF